MKIVKYIRMEAWHETEVPVSEATWNAYLNEELSEAERQAVEALVEKAVPKNPLDWNEVEIRDEGYR
jgi:hypothetical protein